MKKYIKAILARYKYKMIGPSWYHDKKDKCAIFTAYDEFGVCHEFYINYGTQCARRTMMTTTDLLLKPCDVAFMFWEVA